MKTFINVTAESSPALCYIAFSLLELKSTDTALILIRATILYYMRLDCIVSVKSPSLKESLFAATCAANKSVPNSQESNLNLNLYIYIKGIYLTRAFLSQPQNIILYICSNLYCLSSLF